MAASTYPKLAAGPVGKQIHSIYQERLRMFTSHGQYADSSLLAYVFVLKIPKKEQIPNHISPIEESYTKRKRLANPISRFLSIHPQTPLAQPLKRQRPKYLNPLNLVPHSAPAGPPTGLKFSSRSLPTLRTRSISSSIGMPIMRVSSGLSMGNPYKGLPVEAREKNGYYLTRSGMGKSIHFILRWRVMACLAIRRAAIRYSRRIWIDILNWRK